jgi:HD superfamily phosphodiesterase
MSLFSKLFQFVISTSKKHAIDESHGLTHSMDVLRFAHNIFNSEYMKTPTIREHERLIYVSAILHDMCDKKYMDEQDGIREIEAFLEDKMEPVEIAVIKKIISTMSYSTVKKHGFPELGEYQLAYHIVREADILAAYDFDRCMVYHMQKINQDMEDAFQAANKLFENRIFRHNEDGLLLTDYSKQQSMVLDNAAMNRIGSWQAILRTSTFY